MATTSNPKGSENQGEGNKTADKAYREAASKFAKTHDTAKEARSAERDIEQDPKAYADAEKKGKSKSAGEDRDAKSKKS
jgi:hypothetical protein